LNKLILLISLSIFLYAQYEKGYIDTHGGKSNKLTDKKVDFSKNNFNLFSSPILKKDTNNSINVKDLFK